MSLPWPGVTRDDSDDAERDAAALIRATLRHDREGLSAILRGRGTCEVTPELAVIGELALIAAHLARELGGETALDEYRAAHGGMA